MPRQVLAFSGLHRNGHPLTEADLAQVELGAMANDAVYDDEEHYDDVATI